MRIWTLSLTSEDGLFCGVNGQEEGYQNTRQWEEGEQQAYGGAHQIQIWMSRVQMKPEQWGQMSPTKSGRDTVPGRGRSTFDIQQMKESTIQF